MFFSDIAKHQNDANDLPAGIANGRGAVGNMVLRAVARQQQRVIGKFNHALVRHHQLHRVGHRLARAGVDDAEDLRQRPPAGLRQRPFAEALGRRIHIGDPALRVGGDDGIADRVQRDGQVLLTLAQRSFALDPGLDQAIEAAGELADFVLTGDWQGLRKLVLVGQGNHGMGGGGQRLELAFEHPPGQQASQQGQA